MTNKTRKRIRVTFRVLAVAGFIYAFGTVGALEWGDISLGRGAVQITAGLVALFVGAGLGGL